MFHFSDDLLVLLKPLLGCFSGASEVECGEVVFEVRDSFVPEVVEALLECAFLVCGVMDHPPKILYTVYVERIGILQYFSLNG